MIRGRLKGLRTVITGASRGVGYRVARMFLREGAQVLGVSRQRRTLAKADREFRAYGRAWKALVADTGSPNGPKRIAAAVRSRWGALDFLLNNAAVNPGHRNMAAMADGELEATLNVNVFALHRISRALLPLLKKGRKPRIVNVSSGAGSRGSIETGTDMSAYRLSKWTVNGLTRLWANELKGTVSVVMMDPGWVKTDMGGPQAPDSPELSARRALEIALLPAKVTGVFLHGRKEGGW